MIHRKVFCVLVLTGLRAIALAQPADEAEKSVQIARTDTAPVIDGVLDEEVWYSAGSLEDFHEIQPIEYDVEEAKRLLDEAGYQDPDGDGPETRFVLSYKTSTNEESLLRAQIIQSMLAAVGIGIEIRSFEFATFYSDIRQGNFQLFSLTWTGIIDPHIYNLVLPSASIPPEGANRGRFRNSEFDRLIEAGSLSADPVVRRPFYIDAQRILAHELPYISLYHKVNVGVMSSSLKGYENYLSGELSSLSRMGWTD